MINYNEATLPAILAFETLASLGPVQDVEFAYLMALREHHTREIIAYANQSAATHQFNLDHATAIIYDGIVDDMDDLAQEVVDSAMLENRDIIHGVAL